MAQQHPHYPRGLRRQRPQLHDPQGEGFCIRRGEKITAFAPIRPFCKGCWSTYRHLSARAIRRIQQKFCHRCGAAHATTYGDVSCPVCRDSVPGVAAD